MKGRKFMMNWRIWRRKHSEFVGSKCIVSIVARTGYGLGSGPFARPPLGPTWQVIREPRKIKIKGWVTEWSMKESISDDKVKEVLAQLERAHDRRSKRFYRLGTLRW